MKMPFDDFWNWLRNLDGSQTFKTLGLSKPFSISQTVSGAKAIPRSKNGFPFTKSDALRTWDRFLGLKKAEAYLCRKLQSKNSPHLMASSYARPNNPQKPLPQNWGDSPNLRACPYIAAAIRDYLHQNPTISQKL